MLELATTIGKDIFVGTPTPSDSYIYKASTMWNIFRQKLNVSEFTTSPSFIKSSIRKLILKAQTQGELADRNKLSNNLSQTYKSIAI